MTQMDKKGSDQQSTEGGGEEDPRQMADIFGDPADRSTSELKHCDTNGGGSRGGTVSPAPSQATTLPETGGTGAGTGSARTRKVSHRKVIIHNDGDICLRTYNKSCPHDDDPHYPDPPMHHEMDGEYEDEMHSFYPIFVMIIPKIRIRIHT